MESRRKADFLCPSTPHGFRPIGAYRSFKHQVSVTTFGNRSMRSTKPPLEFLPKMQRLWHQCRSKSGATPPACLSPRRSSQWGNGKVRFRPLRRVPCLPSAAINRTAAETTASSRSAAARECCPRRPRAGQVALRLVLPLVIGVSGHSTSHL
jgi:hypothetical protein